MEKKVKSAKMKELEKAGVNLLCVASTGTTLTHYVNGDSFPLMAALVTLGERYMVVREMLIHAADILQASIDKIISKPLEHAFERVTEEMHATWSAKNADYGSSFDGQGREWR